MLTPSFINALVESFIKLWIRVGLSSGGDADADGQQNPEDNVHASVSDVDSASTWAVESLSSDEEDPTVVHDASAGLAVTGKIGGHVLDDDTEGIIALGTEGAAHIEDMNEGS